MTEDYYNKNELVDAVNDTYHIYKGKSEQTDTPLVDVYKIINVETGVNEGEVSNLARAYAYCVSFEEELRKIREAIREGRKEEVSQLDWVEEDGDFTPTLN